MKPENNWMEDQEESLKLLNSFLKLEENKEVLKDIILRNVISNGYMKGAFMGIRKARELQKTTLLGRLVPKSTDVDKHSVLAYEYYMKKKPNAHTKQDREMFRLMMMKGFKIGFEEFQAKKSN